MQLGLHKEWTRIRPHTPLCTKRMFLSYGSISCELRIPHLWANKTIVMHLSFPIYKMGMIAYLAELLWGLSKITMWSSGPCCGPNTLFFVVAASVLPVLSGLMSHYLSFSSFITSYFTLFCTLYSFTTLEPFHPCLLFTYVSSPVTLSPSLSSSFINHIDHFPGWNYSHLPYVLLQ